MTSCNFRLLISWIGVLSMGTLTLSAQQQAIENPPDWAAEVVWYQIFVERFYNGDPSNDPRPQDMTGAYPGFVPENWRVTPWTHDWYAPDPWFEGLEQQRDLSGNPIEHFNQKVQLRRYGGDLQGVLEKIPYLDSLGITAVFFNPLNDAPSLHKYDARNWRHIDRNFGPDPDGDIAIMAMENPTDPATWHMTSADLLFVEVIRALHARGIRVILDYSWNHTGVDCWAWKDVLTNQQASPYSDWYWVQEWDDPATDTSEFRYRGWAGVPSLPEIRETVHMEHIEKVEPFEGDIYAAAAKQHIFHITQRWLDPNGDGNPDDGVDGFRLDVAAEMPLGFWRDYRRHVRNINPNAYLIGEIWWEQYPDKLLDPLPYLEGDVFDAVMNYRWYRAARHFFNASPDTISVTDLVDSLQNFTGNLPTANNYAMMNLVSSHDVPRVATSLYNKNKYKWNAGPFPGNNYKVNKPDAATRDILRLLLIHQFTYVGAPHIWAGDEMGMWGSDDPSNRKPLIWPEYTFEKEKVHPYSPVETEDEVVFDHAIFDLYRQLTYMRRQHQVLATGDIEFVVADNERRLLAYSRFNEKDEVLAAFNTSQQQQNVELPVKHKGVYINLMDGSSYKASGSKVGIVLEPGTAVVLALSTNSWISVEE